jgi:putative nucleotidyltransferase with HDIG domain
VSDDAIGTPSGAPVPEVPEVEPVAETATVTLDDVHRNPELSLYIASADRVMDAMGYTEHGFRHAHLVGKIAYQVLHRLGFPERDAELARVAGYLHDMGNALSRDGHAQTGAILAYQTLKGTADGADLMTIVAAIANHEETEGTAVSPVSAAVILADKADVHRSRVRKPAEASLEQDIHDRVNYAVEQSFLRVDSTARTVSLELTIDTRISQVMEYFEIFLGRMQMCRHAAAAVDARFQLFANGQELA